MAGSSPAMTTNRKADEARRAATSSALGAVGTRLVSNRSPASSCWQHSRDRADDADQAGRSCSRAPWPVVRWAFYERSLARGRRGQRPRLQRPSLTGYGAGLQTAVSTQTQSALRRLVPPQVRQKHRENADRGEERAKQEHEPDALPVRERAKRRRSDAANAESEAEEETRHHADAAGHQFLPVNDHRGEGRSDHEANHDAERGGRHETDMRQEKGERHHAQD